MKRLFCALCVSVFFMLGAIVTADAKPQTVFPSGIKLYGLYIFLEDLDKNEYVLMESNKGEPVAIFGWVDSVRKSAYFPDPDDSLTSKGSYPMVELIIPKLGGRLQAYLIDDPINPATIAPGYLATVLCQNIKKNAPEVIQGECKVISLGPETEGDEAFAPVYDNKELIDFLGKPRQE